MKFVVSIENQSYITYGIVMKETEKSVKCVCESLFLSERGTSADKLVDEDTLIERSQRERAQYRLVNKTSYIVKYGLFDTYDEMVQAVCEVEKTYQAHVKTTCPIKSKLQQLNLEYSGKVKVLLPEGPAR